MPRVLDVGNCPPDYQAIRRFLEHHFEAEVVQAHQLEDALRILRDGDFDLVLVNRKLDIDYSDGLDVIRSLKLDPSLETIPVMLVSNYPQYQEEAVQAGAVWGFGKNELHAPAARQRVATALQPA